MAIINQFLMIKKSKIKLLISLFVLAFLLVAIFFCIMYGHPLIWKKHDVNLKRFLQQFDQIPLPAGVKQIGNSYKEFGLMGNGNHCDYFVSKLIETDLTIKELENYFDNFSLPPVDSTEIMEYTYELRGATLNGIVISQPWKDPIILGPYFEGTETEKEQKILELQHQEQERIAQQHNLAVSLITDKLFLISSRDGGYVANDLRCN